jgi:hypothetical protein
VAAVREKASKDRSMPRYRYSLGRSLRRRLALGIGTTRVGRIATVPVNSDDARGDTDHHRR